MKDVRRFLRAALVRYDLQVLAKKERYTIPASQKRRNSDDEQEDYALNSNLATASNNPNSVDGSQTIEAEIVQCRR